MGNIHLFLLFVFVLPSSLAVLRLVFVSFLYFVVVVVIWCCHLSVSLFCEKSFVSFLSKTSLVFMCLFYGGDSAPNGACFLEKVMFEKLASFLPLDDCWFSECVGG